MLDELPLDDGELLVVLGIPDQHLEQEAVDLGLGQRVRALRLDGVLRRHHEERRGDAVRVVADRDLALLHDLEERGLHLRGRAVDLVGEEEVAEHRPELGVERPFLRSVDARAHEIRRHEIRGELHARERAAEHAGRRLDRQRLREPGDALDEEVPLRQKADEHPLEHRVLAGDDPANLEERLLELLLRVLRGWLRQFAVLGHAMSLLSRLRVPYESTRPGSLGERCVKRTYERWTPIVIEPT